MRTDPAPGIGPHAAAGVAAGAAVLGLSLAGVAAAWPYFVVASVLFLALGGLCVRNYAACGAIHCAMSGPPYVVLGLAALLAGAGLLDITMRTVWLVFVLILVASFGTEGLYVRFVRRRTA